MALKKAECIRAVSNWSEISKYNIFDYAVFDAEKTKNEIVINSPKMSDLLNNIKQLDEEDIKKYGHKFKHFIYSDLRNSYGAKIIASALIANGYKLGFNKKIELLSDNILLTTKGLNFLLLTSNKIYGQDCGVTKIKNIKNKFNERPNNIYGDLINIIIVDYSFKEGIDIYDTKYVHIFEPTITRADLKQVIGRSVRKCGQKGLQFIPNIGWPLNVYIYDIKIPEELKEKYNANTLHELYIKNSDFDFKKNIILDEITSLCIIGAVDHDLTININEYLITNNISQNGGSSMLIDCNQKCGNRPTKTIPVGLPLFTTVFFVLNMKYPDIFLKLILEICIVNF